MILGVYKFGGASIADSERIENVKNIVQSSRYEKLIVVVSAMGKSTNALEEVWRSREDKTRCSKLITELVKAHLEVCRRLDCYSEDLEMRLTKLADLSELDLSNDEQLIYDQIVSIGELLSTMIVTEYLQKEGVSVAWQDARQLIKTDSTFRAANVDWDSTKSSVQDHCLEKFKKADIILTQGFIGSDQNQNTTTLGREGSDFTAAILAHCLDAQELSIWKDVRGILTADPRKFENVVKIDRLSYKESIEMTYYGAKVIHPKTIKPLENKQIPLFVKSFVNPSGEGTMISSGVELTYPPIVVVEENQALLHFSTRDFSFIGEGHLGQLFKALDNYLLKVNLMKNTAKCFTVCVTSVDDRIEKLISQLQSEYEITVDPKLELLTIRHPNETIIQSLKNEKVILMEERAPKTVQMVVKDAPLMQRKK